MNANVKSALLALATGSLSPEALAVLTANGCGFDAILATKPILSRLGRGEMLTKEELGALSNAGVDVVRLIGLRTPPVPTPSAPPVANGLTLVAKGAQPGVRIYQETLVPANDPFSFLLSKQGIPDEQRKALRSVYNSFVSRAQTRCALAYRNALVAAGVVLGTTDEEKADRHSEAMKIARGRIGLSKTVTGVLAKKGLSPSREQQNEDLISAYRKALAEQGVHIVDALHVSAVNTATDDATEYAQSAASEIRSALPDLFPVA